MSANVFSRAIGDVTTASPPGTAEPVVVLTREPMELKAPSKAFAVEGSLPIWLRSAIKGTRASTLATVVSSLTLMKVDALSDPHAPRAAIIARFGLIAFPGRPGFPPVATR